MGAVRCGMPEKTGICLCGPGGEGFRFHGAGKWKTSGRTERSGSSPAGTTIEGVAALEAAGFRNAVLKGCEAVYKKCTEI